MRTGGRTDMTKLIVAFRNFANAHKNENPRSLTLQRQKNEITFVSNSPRIPKEHCLFGRFPAILALRFEYTAWCKSRLSLDV
jgi:hypothetical protein